VLHTSHEAVALQPLVTSTDALHTPLLLQLQPSEPQK
jgi:hypothetical protein